jgi:hypothetical protein
MSHEARIQDEMANGGDEEKPSVGDHALGIAGCGLGCVYNIIVTAVAIIVVLWILGFI